jgi:hypothetical protein
VLRPPARIRSIGKSRTLLPSCGTVLLVCLVHWYARGRPRAVHPINRYSNPLLLDLASSHNTATLFDIVRAVAQEHLINRYTITDSLSITGCDSLLLRLVLRAVAHDHPINRYSTEDSGISRHMITLLLLCWYCVRSPTIIRSIGLYHGLSYVHQVCSLFVWYCCAPSPTSIRSIGIPAHQTGTLLICSWRLRDYAKRSCR